MLMTTFSTSEAAALLERLKPLIRDAGRVIMDIYATDFDVTKKASRSARSAAEPSRPKG
jgi:3'(2'), 5'-bisphosphate nucleotidase